MKRILKKVIKPFLPKYEVVCTNYYLIPGQPVNKNQSTHAFERGAAAEAKAFYGKVISSEFTKNMAPVEVQLRKIYLKKTTIEQAEFGPIHELKKFKMNN
ncbi:hypothetical protein [Pontibacter harenae]|uniref:hypothetical protein n=1 Tax=Pontibacter harenae TaxID=2894083 RepID=UPI001E43C279|nr:hypothetical protein [Pontibacter harenae]MCC9166416.1 hypothetical protein [Pontibacter harenae]